MMSVNYLKKPPIVRHGVSSEDRPLQKIPVNPAYELEPELLDELYDSPLGNVCAPFPYQLSIFENHIDIYCGDGRIVAMVMRDNFRSFKEFIFTARLMAYSYCFYSVASFTMRDLGILHNGGNAVDKNKYTEKSEEFYPAAQALTYGGVWSGDEVYEPIRYTAKGYETETEMAYGDDASVSREAILTDPVIKDHEIPELNGRLTKNGYA
jgi:hypothetical protein